MNASKPQTAKGSKTNLFAKLSKMSIQDQEPQDSLKLAKKRFHNMTDLITHCPLLHCASQKLYVFVVLP